MVLRILGLKEEEEYAEEVEGKKPDFHHRLSSNEFKLGDETVQFSQGSRMIQRSRRGITKPEGSTEAPVDLERIGHYFKAFFDQYKYSIDSSVTTSTKHQHKFWGGEVNSLHSFHGWTTFDYFEKELFGLLLNSLSIECSEDMSMSCEWIYQTEKSRYISEQEYDLLEIEGELPLQQYDVAVDFGDIKTGQGIVFTSLSMECNNNLDQDATVGIGSRHPQIKAMAAAREIELSLEATLSSNSLFLDIVRKAEYGDSGDVPTDNLVEIPIKITIAPSFTDSKMEIYLPKCEISVEYSGSESDPIDTSFTLKPYQAKLADAFPTEASAGLFPAEILKGRTDCFIYLINSTPNISYAPINTNDDHFNVNFHLTSEEFIGDQMPKTEVSLIRQSGSSNDDSGVIGPKHPDFKGDLYFAGISNGNYQVKIVKPDEARTEMVKNITVNNEDLFVKVDLDAHPVTVFVREQVEEGTGPAIEGACVEIGEDKISTGSDGSCIFYLRNKKYPVKITHKYCETFEGELDVTEAVVSKEFDLVRVESKSITFKVVHDEDKVIPVNDAYVAVYEEIGEEWELIVSGYTNITGEVTLDVPLGYKRISIKKTETHISIIGVPQDFTANMPDTLEFSLVLRQPTKFKGVTKRNEQPIEGAIVNIEDRGSQLLRLVEGTTDADGYVELDVLTGDAVLTVTHEEYSTERSDITIEEDMEPMLIEMEERVIVPFHVHIKDTTEPIAGAVISSEGRDTTTDDEGNAELSCSLGEIHVTVQHTDYQLDTEDLTLNVVKDMDTVDVAMVEQTGSVEVTFKIIKNGENTPISGAHVTFGEITEDSDETGYATIEHEVGTAVARVEHDDYNTITKNVTVTRGMGEVVIGLDPKTPTTLVEAPFYIYNKTTDDPLQGAKVCIGELCSTTDEDGNAVLECEPGSYTADFTCDGFDSDSASVNVSADMNIFSMGLTPVTDSKKKAKRTRKTTKKTTKKN